MAADVEKSSQLGQEVFVQARTSNLVVEEIGSETLVYDLDSKRAHCLNEPVRWIWRQCDGKRTSAEIAAEFGKRYPGADGEASVEAGLRQLMAANLLDGAPAGARTFSRRRVMGVAAPLLVSVAVPTAEAAMSGKTPPKPRARDPRIRPVPPPLPPKARKEG